MNTQYYPKWLQPLVSGPKPRQVQRSGPDQIRSLPVRWIEPRRDYPPEKVIRWVIAARMASLFFAQRYPSDLLRLAPYKSFDFSNDTAKATGLGVVDKISRGDLAREIYALSESDRRVLMNPYAHSLERYLLALDHLWQRLSLLL
jgi:hypothetical protein